MSKVTPWLWFDLEAEEAAEFYTSIFPNSRILGVSRYGEAGPRPAGTVMTVDFELDGQRLFALNGGPQFPFTEAISLAVDCDSQAEVDQYWTRLGEGGQEGPCGWLKDRYGLSWQIVPTRLRELLEETDADTSQRVMAAMLKMGKLEGAELEAAAAGAISPTRRRSGGRRSRHPPTPASPAACSDRRSARAW